MERNVGTVDKFIRSIAVLVFIYLGLTISPWFYLLAGILLLTVIFGTCGPYKWFGINTNKKK